MGSLAACAAEPDDEVSNDENAVKVDTRSPQARAQYDANVAFANGYVPRCVRGDSNRPRVLVTGFGRFMSIDDNATGRIVSKLVPAAVYPVTHAPPAGEVDDPAPQLSVGQATLHLPESGDVDVCAMILPVYWDLAGILIGKEIEAFQPSFVYMNGVAGTRQPLWIELGALNRAAKLEDGSNQLTPSADGEFAKIVEDAPSSEDARGNLLTWNAVGDAVAKAITAASDKVEEDVRFGDLVQGVKFAGYPRSSNTYLCNNVTYLTGWLMSHPGKSTRLLRANPAVHGKINELKFGLQGDFSNVPRVFVHWPSELASKHHEAGASVMQAIIDAQVAALVRGDRPTVGDNALADPTLQGGDTF